MVTTTDCVYCIRAWLLLQTWWSGCIVQYGDCIIKHHIYNTITISNIIWQHYTCWPQEHAHVYITQWHFTNSPWRNLLPFHPEHFSHHNILLAIMCETWVWWAINGIETHSSTRYHVKIVCLVCVNVLFHHRVVTTDSLPVSCRLATQGSHDTQGSCDTQCL